MPSSHSSVLWIHPSPHTGTNGAGRFDDDELETAAGATDEGTEESATEDGGAADDAAPAEDDGFGNSDDACFDEATDEATDDAPATVVTADDAGTDETTGTGDADEAGDDADETAEDVDAGTEEAFDETAEDAEAGTVEDTEEPVPLLADDFDDAHDTIFHLHVVPQTLPHAEEAEDADDPPASHSSPTDCDTMPSPQRIFVQEAVQFGPTPFRVLSSHSSPVLMMPLPQFDDV